MSRSRAKEQILPFVLGVLSCELAFASSAPRTGRQTFSRGQHRVGSVRMSSSVSSLSGRVVGLFEGRNVFTDGSGLYILVQQGEGGPLAGDRERRFIRKTDYGLIRLFEDVNLDLRQLASSVGVLNGGGATLRQRQEGSSLSQQQTANSSSVGRRTGTLPSTGYRYEVIQEGAGRVPTLNDRVKIDLIVWRYGFDGQRKAFENRGEVRRVSDLIDWLREPLLSMREGEIWRITAPPRYPARFRQLRLISIE
ncbi:unnamed protein product [Vitrella brassicaformis CCMP3155]|uniref:Peptidylprolyl isomerase n=1 Tax=Vitrella brassicaformis (strain CCMP3155) TaxID=1169540 RepID=A0A0G4H4M3_VITBC|nr:unnamed protein product [Vitrella brassicaformis CCMP3155]|eukprot:CEM38744.1 unnamed protein product [Vitrella brassicaformis CCMP3155]